MYRTLPVAAARMKESTGTWLKRTGLRRMPLAARQAASMTGPSRAGARSATARSPENPIRPRSLGAPMVTMPRRSSWHPA